MQQALRTHIEDARALAGTLVRAHFTSLRVAEFSEEEWAAAAKAAQQDTTPVQGVRDMVLVIMGASEIETAKQVAR